MICRFAGLLGLHKEAEIGNVLAEVEFLDRSQLIRSELEDTFESHGKVYQVVLEDPQNGSEFPQYIQFYLDILKGKFPVLQENIPVLFSLGRILRVLIPESGKTTWDVFAYYLGQMTELVDENTPEGQIRGIFSWVNYILPTVFSLEETTWEGVSTGLQETDGRKVYGLQEDEIEEVEVHERDFNRPNLDNHSLKLIHDGVETPDWVNTQGVDFMKAYWPLWRADSFLKAYNLTLPYRKGGEKEGVFSWAQSQAYWSLYDTVFTRTVNKGFSRFLRVNLMTGEEFKRTSKVLTPSQFVRLKRDFRPDLAESYLKELYKFSMLFRRSAGERQIRLSRKLGQWEYFWKVYEKCFNHLLKMTGKETLVHNCVARVEKSETKADLYRFVSILKKAQADGRLTFEEASPVWRAFYQKKAEFYPESQVDTWETGVEESLEV